MARLTSKVARVLIVICLMVTALVHYHSDQLFLFFMDTVVMTMIALNWAYPFIVAKLRSGPRERGGR